jgi:trk system potassium uptake protein
LSLAAVTLLLTFVGAPFADALVMSVATLSTTGPLMEFAADAPIMLIQLGDGAKIILCAAMVLGRLETLAIIALLTPALWRT